MRGFERGVKPTTLSVPSGVVKNDPVAVRVLEGAAALIPIRIERRHRQETRRLHSVHRRSPFLGVGEIKDQEVIFCRRTAGSMTMRP